jgi:MFS family permease
VTAPFVALWVTLVVQALTSLAMVVPAVLAPALADQLGFEAQQVGLLLSLAYLCAIPSGLLCASLSPRHGPVRLSQAALIATALGVACYVSGAGLLLLLGAVLIGMAYGVPNPTAAEILTRHAPIARRGVFFSVKQTGVPIGIALAGALLPWLLGLAGWRAALFAICLVLAAVALLIGRHRSVLEPPGTPGAGPTLPSAAAGRSALRSANPAAGLSVAHAPERPASHSSLLGQFVAPVIWVLGVPALRRLCLSAITFSFTQIAFLSFSVSLLKLEHQMSLAVAAGVLSASQVLSVFARVFWGHAADRWIDPGRLLGLLGVLMALSALCLGLAPNDSGLILMLLLALCCAGTAVAWNGVYYADLVRHVRPEEVSRATAATQTLTFLGGVIGASVFAAVVSLAGSYSAAFALCAFLPFTAGVVLLRFRVEPRPRG